MDAHLFDVTIKSYLTEIRNRLDKAAGIGRAADACAGAGFHEKGLEVALDIEQLLYEATHAAECRKSDQPDRPAKLSDLDRWGRTENQAPPQRECNSDRPYAGHDCCQKSNYLAQI